MRHALSNLARTRPSRALALGFALASFLLASWFARIPAVRDGLGLGNGALSLALFGLSLGTLATMPWAGWLLARCGAGRLARWSCIAFALAVPGPALAWDAPSLVLALTFLGGVNGVMVVALNTTALAIEAGGGVAVMAAFQAMFSLGGILGALTGSLAAGLGLPPALHLAMLGLGAALLLHRQRGLDRVASAAVPAGAAGFALPRGPLLGLALILFVVSLAEGAVADWSAVQLTAGLGAGHEVAGLGYALFAAGMTLGRLQGDGWRDRWGEARIVRGGALLAALGLGLGLLLGETPAMLAGYGCAGLGLAGIAPIVLRRAAAVPGTAAGAGVAAVSGLSFAGFLAGPPLIGLLAGLTGLDAALGVVPALLLTLALTRRKLPGGCIPAGEGRGHPPRRGTRPAAAHAEQPRPGLGNG